MKKKILVIENDKSIRELITFLLTEEGYDIKAVDTEKEIFEHLENYKPNAILLDIIKPSDMGAKLCEQLKDTESTKNIPVIVLSTHFKIVDFVSECADEIVAKPFDISKLVNTIEKQIAA